MNSKTLYLCGVFMVPLLSGPPRTQAQSASKCIEYAELYESQRNYTSALHWYYAGCLKGNSKNLSVGKEGYFRVIPLSIKDKYDSASKAENFEVKLKRFEKAGNFIKTQRTRWPNEQDKRRIVPEWADYQRTLAELTIPKLKEGEEIGTRDAMETAWDAMERIITEQRKLFNYKDEREQVLIDFDTEAYMRKISQLGCGEVDNAVSVIQATYAAGKFRKAYLEAIKVQALVENLDCTDDRPANIMKQALANGGISVAVFPFKGQENLRNIDNDIVSGINSLEDPFMSGIDPRVLENQLLQKDISIEDAYTADIVSLSKLGKLFGFNCIVNGKMLLAEAGNGNVTSKQFIAYKVSSDNYGKFAHESVRFSEHIGKQTSRYKAQVKVVDTKTKAILYSDIVEYSYTDEIHYAVSPVRFSDLSQREFDNFRGDTGTLGGDLVSALGASIAPADVQKWRPQWVALEDERRNFIGQEEIIKTFSMKIAVRVRDVIENNYGVK